MDNNKVIFINLVEMKKYEGLEGKSIGGGRFVNENGYGHELFNFKNFNGFHYGYTPPCGKVDIKKIALSNDEINQDEYGKYIDNVLVIFTGSKGKGGRKIIGYYKNARVYAKCIEGDESRFIDNEKGCAGWNISCKVEDAYLIPEEERSYYLTHATPSIPGYGQSPLWYAKKVEEFDERNKALSYIESIEQKNDLITRIYDEIKYNEGNRKPKTFLSIQRSQIARNKCLDYYGYTCQICGFNFEKEYGIIGKNYIEVHHIENISIVTDIEGYDGTDPVKDLIPVCSNCHSMLHKKKPAYKPEEIKVMLKKV